MITAEMIEEAKSLLRKEWSEAGEQVISKSAEVKTEGMEINGFLSHCTACGGNWGGMLLTGIKELFPAVYEVIPQKMGKSAFFCLCGVLTLCGVDTSERG